MTYVCLKPIYGVRPFIEALESGKTFDKIFIQKGLRGANHTILYELIKKHHLCFQSVPLEKLNRLTRKNHQGVVAFTSPIDFHQLENFIPQIYEQGKIPLLLVLDGITDVRNFGAIVRTAECVGAHAVILSAKRSAPINADAIKTSCGALFKLPICKEKDLAKSLRFLKSFGIQIIAASEKAHTLVYKSELSGPLAIVMGSEENGISPSCLDLVDNHLKLPMFGEIRSLNVSVACGAMLYEVLRQRLTTE